MADSTGSTAATAPSEPAHPPGSALATSNAAADAYVEASADVASRFEYYKQKVGLVAGPLLALMVWYWSTTKAPALPALMALCVTWWITEALPAAVVALFAAVGAVLTGLASPTQAFGSFGKPQLFLFVGSFFIAEAMRIHGLGERMARSLMSVARGRLSLLVMLGLTAFLLSMAMSNAAATAIVLPIALSAAGPSDRKFQAAVVLMVAWAASVGGLGTPVGTPPNLFGIAALRQHGLDLGFVEWMAMGVPIGLVMMLALVLVLAWFFGVKRGMSLPDQLHRAPRRWQVGEYSVVVVVGLAVLGWLLPSIVEAVSSQVGPGSAAMWMRTHLTEEVVAVIAGALLFILPGGRRGVGGGKRPALTWSEATQIDWGVILLFGGGILLGNLANSTGLSAEWGRSLVALTSAHSTWGIVALCTGIAIVLSEVTSNTATATLMAPLAADLAHAAGAAPIPAVLGATLGASFGFMMPISTAPNALAYATGTVSMGQMMRTGIVFDIVGFVLIVGGLRIICPLMGWM
ncbi:MAG: DASS family sodium-coupled anion symporter [Kofleriaceae bacterium]|nr:DASS family sodium-coupled anion symporter [Kofleriaceae bacterium]